MRLRVTWRGLWIYRQSETLVFLWWNRWHWKPVVHPGLGVGGWMFYWLSCCLERVVFDANDWGEEAAEDLSAMVQSMMEFESKQGSENEQTDKIIRGIRQGGEAAGIARVIKSLKENENAARADMVRFRGQTDYYRGKVIAYQVAAELVKELQRVEFAEPC